MSRTYLDPENTLRITHQPDGVMPVPPRRGPPQTASPPDPLRGPKAIVLYSAALSFALSMAALAFYAWKAAGILALFGL